MYTIVQLANNYKIGNNLNESSQLVSTIRCQQGGGSTAYANALEQAQAELIELAWPPGRPERDRLLLGRRREHRARRTTPPPRRTAASPCQQGVSSASVIKGQGTLIYTIGYDLDAVDGGANICASGVTGAPSRRRSPPTTRFA